MDPLNHSGLKFVSSRSGYTPGLFREKDFKNTNIGKVVSSLLSNPCSLHLPLLCEKKIFEDPLQMKKMKVKM